MAADIDQDVEELEEALRKCKLERDRAKYWSDSREEVLEDLMTENKAMKDQIRLLRDKDGSLPIHINHENALANVRVIEVLTKQCLIFKEMLEKRNKKLDVLMLVSDWMISQYAVESDSGAESKPSQADLEELQAEKDRLQQQMEQVQEEKKQLQEEKMQIQYNIKQLQDGNDRMRSELRIVDTEKENQSSTINEVTESLSYAMVEKNAAQEELVSVKARVKEQDQTKEALANELIQTERQFERFFNDNAELKTENANYQKQLKDQHKQLVDQADKIVRLEANPKTLETSRTETD